MKISDLIKMGLRNLGRRKARTGLTIIGVVIGTISIMIMISIGIGMNTNFRKQVMELGSLTTITINQYQDIYNDKGEWQDYKEQAMDDSLLSSLNTLDHVKAVSAVIQKDVRITTGQYEMNASIMGIDCEAMQIFGFPELTYGTYPTKENPEVIVMGSQMLNWFSKPNVYYYAPAEIDVTTSKFKLQFNSWEYQTNPNKRARKYNIDVAVPVYNEDAGTQYDYSCYMDIDLMKKWYGEFIKTIKSKEDQAKAKKSLSNYTQIMVNVDNVKNVEKVQKAIKELGFDSSSLTMYTKPMEETSKMLQMVLGGVGAVAMLVSAISIANTMIMSIYERTKEIGVMKVLGCLIKDIKKLFLFEAAMIGLIGGIVGIIISYLGSFLINKYGRPLFSAIMQSGSLYGQVGDTNFSIIPIWLPFLAAGFAMFVGVISGYIPARRATKISAIEAMKSEG